MNQEQSWHWDEAPTHASHPPYASSKKFEARPIRALRNTTNQTSRTSLRPAAEHDAHVNSPGYCSSTELVFSASRTVPPQRTRAVRPSQADPGAKDLMLPLALSRNHEVIEEPHGSGKDGKFGRVCAKAGDQTHRAKFSPIRFSLTSVRDLARQAPGTGPSRPLPGRALQVMPRKSSSCSTDP